MGKEAMFKLDKAYFEFARSYDCSKTDYFPGIYRLIYTMSFGGCGASETSEIENELRKIEALSKPDIELLGLDAISYPFILIGIHKSIIYGRMKYTEELMNLGRIALTVSGYPEDEYWLEFYRKIHLIFHGIINGVTDSVYYPLLVTLVSDNVSCKGKENVYKCKVLAILGDLEKYDEVKHTGIRKTPGLYYAIDKDLEYVSKVFAFDEKLERYRKALERYDVSKPSLTNSVTYFISGSFINKTYTEYIEEKRKKIIERERVVPVLLAFTK